MRNINPKISYDTKDEKMIPRIISTMAVLAMILGGTAAPAVVTDAADFSLSLEDISFDDQVIREKKLPPPEEIPVNDCIKDLANSDIKIMIDPGHFSHYNQSPVYSPYWESVMTWKLSNYLQEELQALGAHADLTKSSLDEDPSLNDRGFLSKGYDLFISVHSNAENDTYSDAPMAFVYQDLPWTTIDDVSADVGKLLADTTASVMGTRQKGSVERRKGTEDHDNNGIMDDEWYSVLFGSRYVGTPGILMEHSFHTNYRSAVWLYNDENLKKLAKAEAKVIYDYFKKKKDKEILKETLREKSESTLTPLKVSLGYEDTEDIIYEPIGSSSDISSEQAFEYTGDTDLLKGDVNFDGMITASDATMVLNEYTLISSGKNGNLTEIQRMYADADSDGIISGNDATMILQYATLLASDS